VVTIRGRRGSGHGAKHDKRVTDLVDHAVRYVDLGEGDWDNIKETLMKKARELRASKPYLSGHHWSLSRIGVVEYAVDDAIETLKSRVAKGVVQSRL